MATTIQKWGNSLGIRIPKALAEQVSLLDGSEVDIVAEGGVLTIRPVRKRKRKYTLEGLLAQAKGPNPHRKLFSDGPRGRELL
jgi:antitoxin MazE